MKKVLVVVGTRPEAIKLFPVFKALKNGNRGYETFLLTTGQHGAEMLNPLLDFFAVSVDFELQIPNRSLNDFSANLLLSIEKIVVEHQFDMIVVQGDTTSSAIASMAAFYRRVKIAHVEAGLRTYNKNSPFPEEMNRRLISLMADVHFAPTETARQNLMAERVGGRIEVVGNTVIDSLLEASARINASNEKYEAKMRNFAHRRCKIVIITAHRRENIGKNFMEIYFAIRALSRVYDDYVFVLPLHPNPQIRLSTVENLQAIPNVFLIEPLPYDEMVFLLKNCYLIMTDSGGLQEEGPSLDKPVLVLRDTTERPEGIAAGCSLLAGVEAGDIIATFKQVVDNPDVYQKMASATNPYGSGDASKKIATCIGSFFEMDACVPFNSQ